MRPVLRRAVATGACVLALALAGCGRHVAPGAPVTFAPADTPWLFANSKPVPADLTQAWTDVVSAGVPAQVARLGTFARMVGADHPSIAKVLDAVQAELANVKSRDELARTTGLAQSGLFAFYGIGDVPVLRAELASPDAFKAFWQRVEKRAGMAARTATIDRQDYWSAGGADAKVRVIVAIEGRQLVATVAPANAGADMLKALLGLSKPAKSAADWLARIDSQRGYTDYGSGFVDLPKLFANLFNGQDKVTQAFAKDLGVRSPIPHAPASSTPWPVRFRWPAWASRPTPARSCGRASISNWRLHCAARWPRSSNRCPAWGQPPTPRCSTG